MKSIQNTIGIFAILLFNLSCNPTNSDPVVPSIDNIKQNTVEEEEEKEQEEDNVSNEIETISWKNWYLSVPIDKGDGKATSIGYESIINDQLTEEQRKYFYVNEDGSYTLWTKFTGFTTSGLSELGERYCRTELREYWQGNQDTKDNWSMSTGVHILESTLQVNFVEGNGRTIVAQVHGKESEGIDGNPATIKIRWNNGMIQADYYTKPNDGDEWSSKYDDKLDLGRVDNEVFTFKIKIEEGKFYAALICEEKGLDVDYTEIYDYVGNGYIHENYFKTGNYYGWNDDYEKAAQVKLYKVVTEHR
ncbi:polysaccharide lyase family 7 protein [Flammeovirga pectinis]|uniref:Polysaccharide lyase family 7 protein n=1 Tax=Flammeovirga pectinis TaxID=2494373 RepID=A0A3Q9FT27_9BACT|nr:polysaccharide lyase family 7 protein [Flammeovirga pectinis]AZQ63823.1 polysaccharide lyase family 7 protein [Flammeovirga pectinis]